MKKREAIAKTLQDETRVRKADWLENNFVYYSSKNANILWPNGDLYSAMNCNFEEEGWEVYRQKVVAKGVIELFQKHKEIVEQTREDTLRWQTSFGVIKTYTDPSDIVVFARYELTTGHVIWDSEKVGEVFTLLYDSNTKESSHET